MIGVHLHSGWFAVTTPVVGQMCHIKEVGYWFCFPVEHLIAERDSGEIMFIHTETFHRTFDNLILFLVTMPCR